MTNNTTNSNIISQSTQEKDLSQIRREYMRSSLSRKNLPESPIYLFDNWLQFALEEGINDPTAMVVATVDSSGQAYQRAALLKHYDVKGMLFYTNLNSRKAKHLGTNPRVSLLFPWFSLDRQVMVLGTVQILSRTEAESYFHSRPRDSQIGVLASHQSSIISSRAALDEKFLSIKSSFHQKDIPVPSFWGGYRVEVDTMEFWQGGKYRLHDRFIYQRSKKLWQIDRLAP